MARAIVLDAADGGLAVACALRRRGVPVTVVAVPGYRWVTRARGIDGRIATTRAEWLAELDDLASLGRGVLIPASDRAVEFVARERNRIPPDLYSFEGPSSAHLELTDKRRCTGWQRRPECGRLRCNASPVAPSSMPSLRAPPILRCSSRCYHTSTATCSESAAIFSSQSGRPQGRRRSSA